MTQRILVTGGAGFIGSHLCDRLIARGDEVIVLDDLSGGSRDNLSNLLNHPRLTFIEANILDLPTLQTQLTGIHHIFHLAALISGYDSLYKPDEYIDLNLKGLMRVIELAAAQHASISFASSSTVYGGSQEITKQESQNPQPITMYALSKLAGEHMLEMYHRLHGFEYVALRLFNVYGPRQNPTHPYANVTCKFSQAAALKLPIKIYGDGDQTRDFIYVDDVVEALLMTMSGAKSRLYNVGTGEDHSILYLMKTLEEISGRAFEVERCEPWPNDIRKIIASVEKLSEEVGWRARVDLREGLAATVAFFEGSR
jgi:UDP-glucose 4-epimerase